MCSNLSYLISERVPTLTHLNLCLPILFDLNKTCHSSSYASSLYQPDLNLHLISRANPCGSMLRWWISWYSALRFVSQLYRILFKILTHITLLCDFSLGFNDPTTMLPHSESDIYWGIKITWINVLQYSWSNEAQNTNQASIYSHLLLDKTFSCKTTAQHALLRQNRFQPNAHCLMRDFPSLLHEFSFL